MYEKTCPVCKRRSYSSSLQSPWICPEFDIVNGKRYGCGTDITNEPAYEAEIDELVVTDREVQDA